MKKLIYLCVILALIGSVHFSVQAQTSKNQQKMKMKEQDLEKSFGTIEGTFLIKDVKTGKTFIYNRKGANERFTPESTFKIPNALIGLQTDAVRDEYDVKRWDGNVRQFESWNRDHTLGSAMRESAIWYYQEMARDIGETQMKDWVSRLDYGNKDISGGIDHFWLDSTLKITPFEQLNFIEKLYDEELPFDHSVIKTVKRMLIQEEGDSFTLYGKSGTRLSDLGLGWYVGFIKTNKQDFIFVTNVQGSGSQAKAITVDILKDYQIMNY